MLRWSQAQLLDLLGPIDTPDEALLMAKWEGLAPLCGMRCARAVEGCVREAYGALCGAHQAVSAGDAEIAGVMRVLAADEARHASLSFAIDAWMKPRLSREARAHIARDQREAFAQLRADVQRPQAHELHELAGVPRPPEARRLLDALEERVLA